MKEIQVTILFLIFSLFGNLLAKEYPLLAKIGEKNSILVLDMHNNQSDTIYNSEFDDVRKLTISPTQNYLAFIETRKGIVENREYSVLPSNQLRVIHKNGRTIAVIKKDVQKYVWSPDGENLAFITGSYYEGGVGFKPDKLFIFSIAHNSLDSLETKYDPYAIYWSYIGNYLYVKNLRFIENKNIAKIDLDDQISSLTDFKDLWFSPDEKYYVHFPDQIDSKFRLYEALNNNDITHIIPAGLGLPLRWIPPSNTYFLFKKTKTERLEKKVGAFKIITKEKPQTTKFTILDVESQKIVKIIENVLDTGFISHDSVIDFKRDGKIMGTKF